jgi:hypothetical protein
VQHVFTSNSLICMDASPPPISSTVPSQLIHRSEIINKVSSRNLVFETVKILKKAFFIIRERFRKRNGN